MGPRVAGVAFAVNNATGDWEVPVPQIAAPIAGSDQWVGPI
jgi:hypothetical protein